MSGKHEDQEDLVSVREVPDEATATLLCDFLKAQGIEATAVPVQIPWLGPIETMHHGFWGRVEVLEEDAERASALIQEYLSATPEPEPDEESS